MFEYSCEVSWRRSGTEPFIDNRYSRAHCWTFDGGCTVPASSSPHIVPLPYSVESHVDPEEALVAALSSCHMLFFLHLAGLRHHIVDSYIDTPVGVMMADEDGNISMTQVTLRPVVTFSQEVVPVDEIATLHDEAHRRCFIARSVKTIIKIDLNGDE